jgi:hypothetical protein
MTTPTTHHPEFKDLARASRLVVALAPSDSERLAAGAELELVVPHRLASPACFDRQFLSAHYGRGGGVGRGRRVGRGLGVTLGVTVGVALGDGLIVGVGVAVGVGVTVGIGVVVGVGVGVGTPPGTLNL